MAVVNIREVYPGVSLGLWKMDETVEQLFEQYSHLQAYRSQLEEKYKNDGRKLEFLAIRALMYEMLKTNGASKGLLSHAGDITHNEAGKPLFRGYHISVSHTKGYAALILSKIRKWRWISNTSMIGLSASLLNSCARMRRRKIWMPSWCIGVPRKRSSNYSLKKN